MEDLKKASNLVNKKIFGGFWRKTPSFLSLFLGV